MTYPALKNFLDLRISTTDSNEASSIAQNGYIGRPRQLRNYALWVNLYPRDIIIQVKADKSVFIKKDEATKAQRISVDINESLIDWYRLVYPTQYTLDNIIHVKYPRDNDFRWLTIDGGEVVMSQISIVSQNGDFFLFVTEQYRGKPYVGDHGIYIKDCQNLDPVSWPQLQSALAILLSDHKLLDFTGHDKKYDGLSESLATAVFLEDTDISRLGPLNGEVVWYNPALHFGVLRLNIDGHIVCARVHESKIGNSYEPKILCSGDRVEVVGITGSTANTRGFETGFQLDAESVNILERGFMYKKQYLSR